MLGKCSRTVVSLGYRLHAVIEAGPCGDRIMTDRRDALLLTRLACSGNLTAVYVATEADEAVSDSVCACEEAVREQRNGRPWLKALLLRNGVRYNGLSSWTDAHLHRLSSLKLPLLAHQIAFQEYHPNPQAYPPTTPFSHRCPPPRLPRLKA